MSDNERADFARFTNELALVIRRFGTNSVQYFRAMREYGKRIHEQAQAAEHAAA